MISTQELCKGMGINRTKLDHWIARGFLVPQRPMKAGFPRIWNLQDAMRAVITADLDGHGIKLSVWGRTNAAILAEVLATDLLRYESGNILAIYAATAKGPITSRILRAHQVLELLNGPAQSFLLLIHLDLLERKLRDTFPDIEV